MGYTHYWYQGKEIREETFQAIKEDFRKLLPVFESYGILLADGLGHNDPVLNDNEIIFNGKEKCGHPENHNLGLTWPMPDAGGVGNSDTADVGTWLAGSTLYTRCCNGDCSYETFYFPRVVRRDDYIVDGFAFGSCKTAFRPYDVAVTAFLVIAKHHLGNEIRVKSDGEDPNWFDAKQICQMELGYGMGFTLGKEGLEAMSQ